MRLVSVGVFWGECSLASIFSEYIEYNTQYVGSVREKYFLFWPKWIQDTEFLIRIVEATLRYIVYIIANGNAKILINISELEKRSNEIHFGYWFSLVGILDVMDFLTFIQCIK